MSCSLILLAYASFSDCLENIKDKENSRRNNSNNSLNNNLDFNSLNSVSIGESGIRNSNSNDNNSSNNSNRNNNDGNRVDCAAQNHKTEHTVLINDSNNLNNLNNLNNSTYHTSSYQNIEIDSRPDPRSAEHEFENVNSPNIANIRRSDLFFNLLNNAGNFFGFLLPGDVRSNPVRYTVIDSSAEGGTLDRSVPHIEVHTQPAGLVSYPH